MKVLLKLLLLTSLISVANAEVVEIHNTEGKYSFVPENTEVIKVTISSNLRKNYLTEVLKAIQTKGVPVRIGYNCGVTDRSGLRLTNVCDWKEIIYDGESVMSYSGPKMRTEEISSHVELVKLIVSAGLMLLSNLLVCLLFKFKLKTGKDLGGAIATGVIITSAVSAAIWLLVIVGAVGVITTLIAGSIGAAVGAIVALIIVVESDSYRWYIIFSLMFYMLVMLTFPYIY